MEADETHLQLYTLEYQKAAERYDNIYRSIWTIFSYLTAVAAGFLAFGSDRIEPHALICFAATPLLFWFWTTYMPLDRYGNQVVNRLRELESLLNNRFGTDLKHFHGPAHGLSLCGGMVRAIFNPNPYSPKPLQTGSPRIVTRLWAWWEQARKFYRFFASLTDLWKQVHRARFAIVLIFIVLHFLVFWQMILSWRSCQPLFREKPAAATSVGRSQ
jgi:hypothetical protein